MKSKVLMVLIGLTLTLSMVLGILAGCGPAATPTATGKPTGTATAKPTATATVKPTTTASPKPTAAGEVFNWRCQSSSSAGDALWWAQKAWTNDIRTMSGGRLDLELFPNGAIVSRNEAFDAVSTGAIECTPTASENDWGGKDQLFEINNIPAGMELIVQLAWENYTTEEDPVPPGEKLLAGLYAKFNIKAFNVSSSTPEVEYLANKKIVKPADYRGLTFRGAGWELEVISQPEFGAKPVFIPTADLFSSLQTGVIDAMESSNPNNNWINGYQDITKYWGFPGMHNLSQTSHSMVNMQAWNSLPPDLQKIYEVACKAQQLRNSCFSLVESAKRMPMLAEKGITLVYENPEVQLFWRNMMLKSGQERAAKYPEFGVELQKALEFQYLLDAYLDLQHPVYDKTYPGKKENLKGFAWE